MKEFATVAQTGAHNEIRVVPAQDGGFVVLKVRGAGYVEEAIAAVSTLPELANIITFIYASGKNVSDPDFAELDEVVTKDVGDSAAPSDGGTPTAFDLHPLNQPDLNRRRQAAANAIVAVVGKDGQEREYGFIDTEAAHICCIAFGNAGLKFRYAKLKDGEIEEPKRSNNFAEATDGSGSVAIGAEIGEGESVLYVVTAGTREDPEKIVNVFYDEEVAKRVCEVVWAIGGSANYRPARYI